MIEELTTDEARNGGKSPLWTVPESRVCFKGFDCLSDIPS